MRQLSWGAVHVWRRNFESWKPFVGSFLVAALGNPMLFLGAVGYGLGRFVDPIEGATYAAFLAPGLLASTAMNSASFEATFGSYTRLSEQNTYLAILVTPCSVADIVAGDALWAATKSVVSTGVVLVVTAAAGLIPSPLAIAVLPAALLTGLCFAALGIVATARARSYAFFDYYFTLGISVMFYFSGVVFPLDGLPAWGQRIAWCLPLTHAAALCRALARGDAGWLALGNVAVLAVYAGVALVLAERLVRRRLVV